MLYERWREIAREYGKQTALSDLGTGRNWTFAELAAEAERRGECGPIVFPQGITADFILAVLDAWRLRKIACPLEPRQARPEGLRSVPPEIVHLKTTSASSSAPRLIAFTAAQLLADAENIVRTMGLRPDWPNLGVISLAHSYGFSNLVLPLLLHGIPLVLTGSALPESLKRAALTQPELTLAAVPALWSAWLEAGTIPANVRLAISAGAPLSGALEKKSFETCGLKLHNFYGSSECGGIAYDGSAEPREDDTFAGTALSGVKLDVAEDGCLEVRGSSVGQSYWPEPKAGLQDGCFRTGDLAVIRDGRVYLRGRASDQINVAGRKVLPELIEKVLKTHPQVQECLAFGVPAPDDTRGDTIVACVTGDATVKGETLRQFALSKLADWQVPRDWWMVPSLEVNGRGKLSRAEWRKRYLDRVGESRSTQKEIGTAAKS